MRTLITLLAGLGYVAALAGCNSMDALTPQVDVGGGTFNSPPVNQRDLAAMEQQTAYVEPPSSTYAQNAPLAATTPPAGFVEGPDGTLMVQGDADYTDPAGSLGAQASRLRQGEMPMQERQVSRAAPLADPIDDTPREQAAAEERSPAPIRLADEDAPVEEPQKAAALAPAAAASTIRFLPIIGAPVEAVTPLSKQLGAEARAHGITIKSASDPSSQHILKGYFSALKDGDSTTIVYVWDVLDGSGNRLHRIQGQDTVAASAADLWSVVPAQTMQTIATKTIGAYLDWRAGQAG
jgi:hypothetical protein